MVIAVNTIAASDFGTVDTVRFLKDLVPLWAQAHPEHRFLLLTTHAAQSKATHPENLEYVEVRPLPTGAAKRYLWYQVTLPGVLKKKGAGLCLTLETGPANPRVPLVVLVSDLRGLHTSRGAGRTSRWWYKTSVKKVLPAANLVLTFSDMIAREVRDRFSVPQERILKVPPGVDPLCNPIEETALKETVKSRYSEGHEYFLCAGPIGKKQVLVPLLKAFSVFKKRQKSGMKLLLAGPRHSSFEDFARELSLYKYRQEVIILHPSSEGEFREVMGAAYAMLWPEPIAGFAVGPLGALSSAIPVAVASSESSREILGEAALYFEQDHIQQIASQMMLLYRDEDLRNALISRGLTLAGSYSQAHASLEIWNALAPLVQP